MIDGLIPHVAYRDSGVPWLGTLPVGWEAVSVRRVCRVFAGATPSRATPDYWLDGTIPWLASGDVNARRITGASQFITDAGFAASSTKWIRPGSLVVALAGQGKTKGMVATVEFPATCNQSLGVLEPDPKRSDYRFLAYYLETRYFDLRGLVGDGIRDGLNLDHLKAIPTPLPPLEEQLAIVRFLDHADRRIRRYIAAKKKLIALLNEQKQAIIHRAVTRGLDPNIGLKPSGVEGLGDVPEHWEVRRLGRLGRVFNGTTPSRAQSAYWSNGTIPWLSSSKVNERLITAPSELITARALRECGLSLVPSGSLVMGLIGQGRTRGMCALLAIDACISQNLAAVVAGSVLSGEFLYYALISSYKGIRELGRGGNQAALNCEIVGRLPIPVPPMKEQAAICEALKTQIAGLVLLEHRPDREIALLREYRTRLIADVVTGKLDVRKAAARLPDEAEPELLDDSDALEEGDESEDEMDLDGAADEAEA